MCPSSCSAQNLEALYADDKFVSRVAAIVVDGFMWSLGIC